MTRSTLATALALLTAPILVLTGCAVTPSGAQVEDKSLSIVCGNDEALCENVIARFRQTTGVDATYVRLSGGEVIARLEARGKGTPPEFDVWWGGPADSFAAAAGRGLLAAYDSPARANVRDQYKDKEGYWTGYDMDPLALCSSKSALDKLGVAVPDSWDALLDPKYKNNFATAHPATSGTGFNVLWTQVVRFDKDEDKSFGFMKQLHNNVLQYTKSGSAPMQMVTRGEIATAPIFASSCHRAIQEGNKDLVVSFPKEGVGIEVGATAVVADTPRRAMAEKFTDWALGDEAFQAFLDTGYPVFRSTADGTTNGFEKIQDVPVLAAYNPAEAGPRRADLAERFEKDIATKPTE